MKIIIKNPNDKFLLVCIPGGPGMGPKSFERLADILNINVALYDPTTIFIHSFQGHVDDLIKNLPKDYQIILCGHSFGGLIATRTYLKIPTEVTGLICLSVPFSNDAFKSLGDSFAKHMTPELEKAGAEFEKNPTNQNMVEWFCNYDELFFHKNNIANGNAMMRADTSSAKNFLEARDDNDHLEDMLGKLKKSSLPKLYINGKEDKLIIPSVASKEAQDGGFSYAEIPNAGHFVHFDNASDCAKEIAQFVFNIGGK